MHSLDNWCNHVVILYTPVSHPILQPVSSLCGYIEHITAKRGNLIITGSSYSLVNALSNVQILQTWFDLDLWPFKLKLHYIREKNYNFCMRSTFAFNRIRIFRFFFNFCTLQDGLYFDSCNLVYIYFMFETGGCISFKSDRISITTI